MTWILGPGPEYRKVNLPTSGYLAASSNRSDSDCIRRDRLDEALRARRERDGFRIVSPDPAPRPALRPDLAAEMFWYVLAVCVPASVLLAALIVRFAR